MSKKIIKCVSCEVEVKKNLTEIIHDDTFAFLSNPPSIPFGIYCIPCFEAKVRTHIDNYNDLLDKAKNVNLYYVAQSKESRFVRRKEKPIHISDARSREDAILLLAFRAVELGFNAIVDVELNSKKIRNGGWHYSVWDATAIPTNIDESYLNRKNSIETV